MLRCVTMHVSPMKKCASDMASAGLTSSAVGSAIPCTATKQISTSTATSSIDTNGFTTDGRSCSGLPIFLSANSRTPGTNSTLVKNAAIDQVNSSSDPV